MGGERQYFDLAVTTGASISVWGYETHNPEKMQQRTSCLQRHVGAMHSPLSPASLFWDPRNRLLEGGK
jgi:hypothetical protein